MNLHNEQVTFHGQVQEIKDAQNDARLEKHLKLKHSLNETSLDTAHHRSMAFVTERSSTLMAMTGLQTLPQSFASFRCQQHTQSTNNHEITVGIKGANRNDSKDDSNAQAVMFEDKNDDEDDGYDEEEKPPWMV